MTDPFERLAAARSTEYVGSAADGLITVTVKGGVVAAVTVDPHAIRSGDVDLAGAFKEAANDALRQSLAALRDLALPSAAAAREKLAEIKEDAALRQQELLRVMQSNTDVITTVSALHDGRHYV